MDIGLVLNTMRDPAGVPAHPVLFQGLMIFTWIFHIAFVHLTLGAGVLALYAFRRAPAPHWAELSMAMTKVAKVGVSLLIVLGVAPLLFTQVIYDPQWYASNVLSAVWAIAFIFTLIIGYCLWFAFYWSNHEGAKKHIGLYAGIALLLFALDGYIMHVLSYQALLPGQWMGWYAPGGVVDTSGSQLHAAQFSRYAFIMSLAAPAVGLYLLAYTDYFGQRADRPADYLAFVRNLGRRIAFAGTLISLILLLWWQFDFPSHTGLVKHPVGWLLVLALFAQLGWIARFATARRGYLLLAAGFIPLGLLALWREIIRIHYLAPFGYDIHNYTVHPDWPSLALFALTLLGVGGLVGGYYLRLIYAAGRVEGVYQAGPRTARLGSAAVAVLIVWIAVFFAYGINIYVQNTIRY